MPPLCGPWTHWNAAYNYTAGAAVALVLLVHTSAKSLDITVTFPSISCCTPDSRTIFISFSRPYELSTLSAYACKVLITQTKLN